MIKRIAWIVPVAAIAFFATMRCSLLNDRHRGVLPAAHQSMSPAFNSSFARVTSGKMETSDGQQHQSTRYPAPT
jgi:hypothetical protein